MDIRQSNRYAAYIEKIGWKVEECDGVKVFFKNVPFLGPFIKIQRPSKKLSQHTINSIVEKYKPWKLSLEFSTQNNSLQDFSINDSPFLPTKTLHIDLVRPEEKIFQNFSEAKRRAVRRAIKNAIVIKQTDAIGDFIKLKTKDFWPMGYFMKKDIEALWESFYPKNCALLIAYKDDKPTAGVFLLFHDNTAYYWMATATDEGKKLAAPTLLVWEALKLSKQRRCKVFDFEGVYDERFHKATKKWQGFTKFKQGFGGNVISFPTPIMKHFRKAF